MSTITIPLTPELDKFINKRIKDGFMNSKAELVRQALNMYREEIEVREILEASRDVRNGVYFKGDLRKLIKKVK